MKALTLTFNNTPIHATRDAWFNATDMAREFEKKPAEWLRLPETQKYIDALCRKSKVGLSHFVKTRRGGALATRGTWLHRKLVVAFARWLSVDFAVWCDERIDELLSDEWQQVRNDTKASNRVMNRAIHIARQRNGEEAKHYDYSNNTFLCYEVLTGKREKLSRDSLSKDDLKLLNEIELENATLSLAGMDYHQRKAALNAKYRNNLAEVAL